MGGTSTDVSLVREGRPTQAGARSVGGRPLLIPMLDIETVGAGGGSIAHVDSGGLLKVGPLSAGADPGPACYGLGASAPTVTDANVVLGTSSSGPLAVRPDGDPPGIGPGRRCRSRRSAWPFGGGDGAGDHFGRHREHGKGHPSHFGASRARPAPLRHGRIRGSRATSCLPARAGTGDSPGRRSAASWRPVRRGAPADRPRLGLRANQPGSPRRRRHRDR